MATEPTTDADEEQEQADKSGQTWEYLAWRMWCSGNRNCSAIARTLQEAEAAGQIDSSPSDHRMVKRALIRESKIAREALDIDETDALSEYIAGLEEQFGEADRIMRHGVNDFAKLGGLNAKLTLLEKLAAAKGIPTKHEKHDATVAGRIVIEVPVVTIAADEHDSAAGGTEVPDSA